ncbi:MAG: hypothetical protein K0S12_2513 [Bacteroidetes bacterium]|nr:hypothetical protein [Bacteroidota bacterium]
MKKILLLALSVVALNTGAQNADDRFWSSISESAVNPLGKRQIVPQKYVTVHLKGTELKDKLFTAPHERSVLIDQSDHPAGSEWNYAAFQSSRSSHYGTGSCESISKLEDLQYFRNRRSIRQW